MVGSLSPGVRNDANFLEKVGVAPRPRQPTSVVHLKLREFPEARAVVIPQRFRVPEALQQRVGRDNLNSCQHLVLTVIINVYIINIYILKILSQNFTTKKFSVKKYPGKLLKKNKKNLILENRYGKSGRVGES